MSCVGLVTNSEWLQPLPVPVSYDPHPLDLGIIVVHCEVVELLDLS